MSPPGWPGRISAATGRESLSRFHGSMRKSSAIWRGMSGWRLIVNELARRNAPVKCSTSANALTDNVRFHRWRTNRVWTRDSGCTFVSMPNSASRPARTAVPMPRSAASIGGSTPGRNIPITSTMRKSAARMAKAAGAANVRPGFRRARVVLEGGSIDVNGCGTLLTTEECLLSKRSNATRP